MNFFVMCLVEKLGFQIAVRLHVFHFSIMLSFFIHFLCFLCLHYEFARCCWTIK